MQRKFKEFYKSNKKIVYSLAIACTCLIFGITIWHIGGFKFKGSTEILSEDESFRKTAQTSARLSKSQYNIDCESQKISFTNVTFPGIFCIAKEGELPLAKKDWLRVSSNAEYDLSSFGYTEKELAKINVYYLSNESVNISLYATTNSETHLIANAQDLIEFSNAVNDGNDFADKKVFLTADIDLSGESSFTPIGTSINKFMGEFDGNGFTISSLNIASSSSNVGLFGYNAGTIKNVVIEGTSISGAGSVGGICGFNEGLVQDCVNNVPITGTSTNVGGVVGLSNGSIRYCKNTATISGVTNVGGIVGGVNKNYDAIIYNCRNLGAVAGSSTSVGGVAGYVNLQSSVKYCTNESAVSGKQKVGGIVGTMNGSASTTETIYNCKNTGTVTGTDSDETFAGGICGEGSYVEIDNCINSGVVKGPICVGGICGYVREKSTIHNCLNDAEVRATLSIAGGIAGKAHGVQTSSVSGYKQYVTIQYCINKGYIRNKATNANHQSACGIAGLSWLIYIDHCYNRGTIYGYRYSAGITVITNKYATYSSATWHKISNCYNSAPAVALEGNSKAAGIAAYWGTGYGTVADNHWIYYTKSQVVSGTKATMGYKKYTSTGSDNGEKLDSCGQSSTKAKNTLISNMTALDNYYKDTFSLNGGWPVYDWEVGITLIRNPFSVIKPKGTEVTLETIAKGVDLTYQWYVADTQDGEGRLIEGETSSTLYATVESQNKWYYCVISGADASANALTQITERALVGPNQSISMFSDLIEETFENAFEDQNILGAISTTYKRMNVTSITFNISTTEPSGEILASGDVSVNKDGSIILYVMSNANDGKVDLIISGKKAIGLTNGQYLFANYPNLTFISGLENVNTQNITSMKAMFKGSSNLENIDLSNFETSRVLDMSETFCDCEKLSDINFGNIDTQRVKYMPKIFEGCEGLTTLDLQVLNTKSVINMSNMFTDCSGLTSLNIENLITSASSSMEGMFKNCSSLETLNVSEFKTIRVTSMKEMFAGCSKLKNLDVKNFRTANVKDISAMFKDCSALTSIDVSIFNTANVENFASMFSGCSNLNEIYLQDFSTAKAKSMGGMFKGCTSLTLVDLSSFSTAGLDGSTNYTSIDGVGDKNLNFMFDGCTALKTIILGQNFARINGTNMFRNCTGLKRIIAKSENAMILSNDTGINALTDAKIYVEKKANLSKYSSATNYGALYEAGKLRAMLEIVGDNPAIVKRNETYEDQGATVAGWAESEKAEYEKLGYTLTTTGLPIDTAETGVYHVIYTLKYSTQTIDTIIN